MAKYRVYMEAGASLSITVDVDDDLTEEAAREQAIERVPPERLA